MSNNIGMSFSRICTLLLVPLVVKLHKSPNRYGKNFLKKFMMIERLVIIPCVFSVVSGFDV